MKKVLMLIVSVFLISCGGPTFEIEGDYINVWYEVLDCEEFQMERTFSDEDGCIIMIDGQKLCYLYNFSNNVYTFTQINVTKQDTLIETTDYTYDAESQELEICDEFDCFSFDFSDLILKREIPGTSCLNQVQLKKL